MAMTDPDMTENEKFYAKGHIKGCLCVLIPVLLIFSVLMLTSFMELNRYQYINNNFILTSGLIYKLMVIECGKFDSENYKYFDYKILSSITIIDNNTTLQSKFICHDNVESKRFRIIAMAEYYDPSINDFIFNIGQMEAFDSVEGCNKNIVELKKQIKEFNQKKYNYHRPLYLLNNNDISLDRENKINFNHGDITYINIILLIFSSCFGGVMLFLCSIYEQIDGNSNKLKISPSAPVEAVPENTIVVKNNETNV
jgi:hypothetical protein